MDKPVDSFMAASPSLWSIKTVLGLILFSFFVCVCAGKCYFNLGRYSEDSATVWIYV